MGRQNQQDSSRGDKEYLCHMLELFPHLSFIYFPLHQSSSKDTDGLILSTLQPLRQHPSHLAYMITLDSLLQSDFSCAGSNK